MACNERFFNKHLREDRQPLTNEFDGITKEPEEELRSFFDEHSLFKNIDIWEKELIRKIQIIAENTREDLRQMIDRSKERFLKAYRNTTINFRLPGETDRYSENEFQQWMEQLKQLQFEIMSLLSAKLNQHPWSLVGPLETEENKTTVSRSSPLRQERFSTVIGSAVLDEGGLLVKHTTKDWNYEYILGEQLYFQGRHTIRFQIEQNGTPYNIFFGCISSQAIQNRISIKSSSTVGWFGSNQVYQHAIRTDLHSYNSNEFETNDILHLTFDCEKQQIELYHEDTNRQHILQVDITQAPFPWQLLIVLTDKDDCIRILPIQKFQLIC